MSNTSVLVIVGLTALALFFGGISFIAWAIGGSRINSRPATLLFWICLTASCVLVWRS